MPEYLLSCDFGTSSCKTALFDGNLRIVASAAAAYPTFYPNHGWAEQDAELWWQALRETVHSILQKHKIDPTDIAGIGIDGMSSMALPVDGRGAPLRPGPIWSDRRAWSEAESFSAAAGVHGTAITRNRFDAASFGSKILWYKRHEPDTYRAARHFLHCNGYLVFRLTGVMTTDISECGLSNLCDTAAGTWSEELCRAAGVSPAVLPDILPCSAVAGRVTSEAGRATGLAPGTPVIAGAMDNTAAVLGMGIHEHGQAYISAGTATNTGICLDSPENPDNFLLLYHSAVPDLWLLNGGVDYGGAGMRWLKDLTGLEYHEINEAAAASSPYSSIPIFLPYMTGQRAPLWNNTASGVFFGITPKTGKEQMIRSVMESIAFGIRWIFEKMARQEFNLTDIRITGGCANSPSWLGIFADILGHPVLVPGEQDTATVGTAMLTGLGIGLFPSVDEARKLLTDRETHQPGNDGRLAAHYQCMFTLFKQLYQDLEQDMSALAGIRAADASGE